MSDAFAYCADCPSVATCKNPQRCPRFTAVRSEGRWLYEINIVVIVAADAADEAMHRGRELARTLERRAEVADARSDHPRHRPDLDGAFAHA